MFVNRNIWDTPDDQMLLQIQGIIAEYERERIRLIDIYQIGLIDNTEIEIKLKSISSKIQQLENEISCLHTQEDKSNNFLIIINNLTDKVTKNLDCYSFK